MKNIHLLTSFILLLLFFTSITLQAQTAGQLLLNGDLSFFNSKDNSDRTVPERTVSGEQIPEINYVFQQYASNLTLNPRVHYFLNEKWSVGLSMGFRQIITRRSVDEIKIGEKSSFLAFSVPSKVQNTTYSYSPKLEVARHWKIGERFSLNLTGTVNWRWATFIVENAESLEFAGTDELSGWSSSLDSLSFFPQNPSIEKTKSKKQYWTVGIVPQLRYVITPRFGLTAAFGGVELTQKVKDDNETFVRATPSWSIRVNPNSWLLGVYGLFGGGKVNDNQ